MSIVVSSLPSPFSCLSLKHTDVPIYECSVYIISSLLMWTTRLLQFRSRSLYTEPTLSSGRWDSGTSFRTERYRRLETGQEIAQVVLLSIALMPISQEIFQVVTSRIWFWFSTLYLVRRRNMVNTRMWVCYCYAQKYKNPVSEARSSRILCVRGLQLRWLHFCNIFVVTYILY